MIIRKEALKSEETPKTSETTTFKFPSTYAGFELHFHLVFFSLRITEKSKFTPNRVFKNKIHSV